MSTHELYAVVMAGGSGTRFWPASRKSLPKQFLPISGSKVMIRDTVDRLKGLVPMERILVVTGAVHAPLVGRHLRKLPPENVLCEPMGRNTTPCVAWAAAEIARRAPDSVQVVLPSDHVIRPAARFRKTLAAAAEEAVDSGALLTLGVKPGFPSTGYGYIERGDLLHTRPGAEICTVSRFVEKPDRERAEAFLRSGRFLWNAGIFVWSTRSILDALQEHAATTLAGIREILRAGDDSTLARIWPGLPSVAIDVAVMEKARSVRVIPIEFEWSDVGSWTALPDVHPADQHAHVIAGGAELLAQDSANCIAYGPRGEIIALLGVRDLVVVHSGKVTLVIPRERAQDVRALVAELEKRNPRFT